MIILSILDDAAKIIIKLAEPFSPVPDNVIDGKSHIVIIRPWDFSNTSERTKKNLFKKCSE